MIKKRPVTRRDRLEENARWRTHLADTLVETTQTSTFDKVKGYFVDSFGDRVKPEKVLEEQNGISKLITNLTPKDHNWDPDTKQYLPKPALMGDPTPEPKIHTPAYRRKYPERYKTGYVPFYDRDRKEKIVTDLPATAKMNGNVVPKESKSAEIKNSTLLSDLEALQKMRVDDARKAAKFRQDMQPRFDDNFEQGLGSLLGVKRKDFSNA
jgi:hypothetical protein